MPTIQGTEEAQKFVDDMLELHKKYESPLRSSRSVVNDLQYRIVKHPSNDIMYHNILELKRARKNIIKIPTSVIKKKKETSPKSRLTKFEVDLMKSSGRIIRTEVSPDEREEPIKATTPDFKEQNKIDCLTMPEILREMEEIERYATEMSP